MKTYFKSTLLILPFFFLGRNSSAQEQDRVITTAVPFLLVAADARAAGMGDQGVATPVDVYSQQWNPAKYVFAERGQGIGFTYTPYLSSLVNDISLANLGYYNRLNERSAFAVGLKYFSMGEIIARETAEDMGISLNPNEFTLDLSYSLKLSENLSMAVAGRYLRSDMKYAEVDQDATAANGFGVDIAAYFIEGPWSAGVNIQNIGPKIQYSEGGQENFIPTNFKLGAGYEFKLDASSNLGTFVEFNKLLVPTPRDFDNDGDIDAEDNEEYNSIGAIEGIFSSWGDAPDGFGEELKEITLALGAEYTYEDVFSLRTGYFTESKEKGARDFISFGAGFKYKAANIDLSYLFNTSDVVSPLEGTLRIGLAFNFGERY